MILLLERRPSDAPDTVYAALNRAQRRIAVCTRDCSVLDEC
jgi:hypothetical protein